MTPQEAEQAMRPFYPHDPNLAMKAMGKALEGNNIPDWILESVVDSYFSFLHIQELEAKIMMLQMSYTDPFGLNTVPYILDTDNRMGFS